MTELHAPQRTARRGRRAAVAAVMMGGLFALDLAAPASAVAAVGDVTVYPIPTIDADPSSIAAGPDGNVWFTESGRDITTNIGTITPDGTIMEYPLSGDFRGPGDVVAGPDGNMWFEDIRSIGRITPAGEVTDHFVPSTGGIGPIGLAAGPDGNLWFGDSGQIGRMTPTGEITYFELEGGSSRGNVTSLTAGPDGNVWFTEYVGDRKVGKITPDGVITEYSVVNSGQGPTSIAAGPDGNVWFTTQGNESIWKMTPAGVATEYPLPATSGFANEMAAGPDGNIWYTTFGDTIGRMTSDGTVTEFSLPAGTHARDITAGPDGKMWFADFYGNQIGTVEAVAEPIAVLDPTAHDFGDQSVATASDPQPFTLTNAGNAPLTVSAAGIGGANPGDYTFATDTCTGATVEPNAQCTVAVTFTPTTTGARTASLDITTDATGSPHTATLTGRGAAADVAIALRAKPRLGILVPKIDYTVDVTNTGPDALQSAQVKVALPFGFTTAPSTDCTPEPGALICDFGAMAAGETRQAKFSMPLRLLVIGNKFTATATRVTSSPYDPNPANDTAQTSCTILTALLVSCG